MCRSLEECEAYQALGGLTGRGQMGPGGMVVKHILEQDLSTLEGSKLAN